MTSAITNGHSVPCRCPKNNGNFLLNEYPEIGGKGFPKVDSLNTLIQLLHEAFEQDNINVEYIQSLMTAYQSNPAEWSKFAKFDQYRYTRNLVDEGNGKFNLMLLCWGKLRFLSFYQHISIYISILSTFS